MPEYLSPGVFIEEIPARLKAIEGVSTSTAGFVGDAERGPIPGTSPASPNFFFAGTFTPAPGFTIPSDEAPPLVTSFADFRRQFGDPGANPLDPLQCGYLGHAVRAFFANGGKRCFIARVRRAGSQASSRVAGTGTFLRLARRVRANDTTVFLDSLRGIGGGTSLDFVRNDPAGTTIATVTVNSYDTQARSVALSATPSAAQDLDPNVIFVRVTGSAPGANGPRFVARSPGTWGDGVSVLVRNADRPAVAVTTPIGGAATNLIQVQSLGGFYRGAFVQIDQGGSNTAPTFLTVDDILPGNTLELSGTVANVQTSGFVRTLEIDVVISDSGSGRVESFPGLSWNSDADPAVRARHYSTVINARSVLVYVLPTWSANGGNLSDESPPAINNQPVTPNGFAARLAGGADGALPPGPSDLVGIDNGPGQRTGIQSLQDIEDVRIIAVPGETSALVQNELIDQCELMRYRFAVLDGQATPAPASVVNDILRHRNAYDSSFAAYYTPWVQVSDGDNTLVLPPSGYLAGIYARVDNDRGVWKAPANEVVLNVTGLQAYFTTGEQDVLNPVGVNCIRRFEGRGIRVWGARTLSSDPEFKYVNVRRFLIFMEASLDRGTQWVVFEPNSPDTWGRVVDSVSAFLFTQWRDGALFGLKPEDSFYVRCDETTMTADDVQNGRLVCEIGVAIVRPAEFVIFRIEQITGFAAAGT